MVNAVTWALGALIVLCCIGSVYFSFRYRRSADGRLQGLYASRMNICMGLMLVFISLIQLFLFSGSTARVIVGAVFLLLGLFNLFAGLRNHAHFSRIGRP